MQNDNEQDDPSTQGGAPPQGGSDDSPDDAGGTNEPMDDDNKMDFEEDEDGGGTVYLEGGTDSQTADNNDFYRNLVFEIDEGTLSSLALDLLEKFDYDKQAREKRDKQYAEGLKRTGLGGEAPGGATFEGASKVVHPMLTTGAVEFEARVIKELFPPGGPVKTFIPGTVTKARWERAERLKRFYNWQLTVQMREFRPEHEKILTQSPLAGVQYGRYAWDERLRRPTVVSAPLDKVLLPAAASSFYTAERITFIDDITELEYKKRVRDGLYRDVELVPVSLPPEKSSAEEARDKIEGVENTAYNEDGLRRTFESNTYIEDLEKDLHDGFDDPYCSYLVYVDESAKQILSIVRNWEQDDDKMERMHWVIEWPFVPWEGVYPIGLTQMIGSLAAAATGALRALLDSAHVNNIPAAAKLKGAQVGGQSKTVNPGQILEVDGGVGAEDIRKLMMPFQYNPPSEVLYQLLGFCVEAGQEAVKTAFEKFSDNNPNAPVGTVYAYIEQGLVVVSAIIGRMHLSMAETLRVLHRINRMYITDKEIRDETGELLARREDFQSPSDVIPVSDPSTPSDAHRFAQVQTLMQRADLKPDLYDQRKVEKVFLEKMRIPNADDLLRAMPEPVEMNAANENAAATLGKPVTAFPEQDHLAHIQVHLDYMNSPVFGMLPIIAPKFLPGMLQHLAEHVSLWYIDRVYQHASAAMGRDISEFLKSKDPEVRAEVDKLIATVSPDIVGKDARALQQLPPIIQRAMQYLQSLQPPPMDPNVQVQSQRNEILKQADDNATAIKREQMQARAKELGLKLVGDQNKAQSGQQTEEMRQDAETRRAAADTTAENMRTAAKLDSAERINQEDNSTALTIAHAEIDSQTKIRQSTGKDSNPGQ